MRFNIEYSANILPGDLSLLLLLRKTITPGAKTHRGLGPASQMLVLHSPVRRDMWVIIEPFLTIPLGQHVATPTVFGFLYRNYPKDQ